MDFSEYAGTIVFILFFLFFLLSKNKRVEKRKGHSAAVFSPFQEEEEIEEYFEEKQNEEKQNEEKQKKKREKKEKPLVLSPPLSPSKKSSSSLRKWMIHHEIFSKPVGFRDRRDL